MAEGTVVVVGNERIRFTFRRPRLGLVVVQIVGSELDDGALGSAPMDELGRDLRRYAPVEIFIDASEAAGALVPVQEQWADWFAQNRASIKHVSMLVRGNYMHFTVELMKFFSRTGDLIRLYLDRAKYDEALAERER